MNKEQIEQIRRDIVADYEERVRAINAERDAELSAVDRIEARLRNFSATSNASTGTTRKVVTLNAQDLFEKNSTATTYERVRAAIENFSGEFTSKDIWRNANADGKGGAIISNSFYPVFSKLLKEMELVVVRKQAGKQPGLYRKGE